MFEPTSYRVYLSFFARKNNCAKLVNGHACSGCTSSPKFPIPGGCFREDKWSESQRIACPVSHVPFPGGCPESQWISGPIPRGHGKRDMLSSGIRTTYPLGIGNLGIGFQPYKQLQTLCSVRYYIILKLGCGVRT